MESLYSLSKSSCHSQISLAQGLPPLYVSHAYVWAAGVLVLLTSVSSSSSILLWNGSAYHIQCTSYQMLGTVSPCVLHSSIYSFPFLTLFSPFWATTCQLSWFAYPFVYGQNLPYFSCHLMLFSALSAIPPFKPTLVPAHCLFLVYFWAISSFMTACMIYSWSIPFTNCSLSLLAYSL